MRHRIYFSVCGEGYGHSSRDMAIARMLSEMGADVHIILELSERIQCYGVQIDT